MPDLSDTVAKCRMGTAKNFTLLLLLYHTQAKLQVITVGPVSQGDADAIYLLCKERGLTDAGLYKSSWA